MSEGQRRVAPEVTLPYELLSEHMAETFCRDASEDDLIVVKSRRFSEGLQQLIHDALETGMGLAANEGTPADVLNAYNAGFAAGQQEAQGE